MPALGAPGTYSQRGAWLPRSGDLTKEIPKKANRSEGLSQPGVQAGGGRGPRGAKSPWPMNTVLRWIEWPLRMGHRWEGFTAHSLESSRECDAGKILEDHLS